MEYQLNDKNFSLTLVPNIFEETCYPNTLLDVTVQSDGFSANTTMDIDIKEFAKFAFDLTHIYETLSGEARIEEPYGQHMYVSFMGNGRGHIAIKGYLNKGNHTGNEQTLEFQNDIDQTCLKNFCYSLLSNYKRYL